MKAGFFSMSIFIGSGTAVCTPFLENMTFNAAAYESLIKHQIQYGTNAIISCGTTGEASTLTGDEHTEVVRTAVSAAKEASADYNRKVPVIAGIGGNNTADCINKAKKMQTLGVDALLCVTPYYNKTSQRGLIAHYTAIAKNTDLPMMLYNVPSRTGMSIASETLAALAAVPNILAVKEASGDFSLIAEIAERCGDRIDIYAGNDDHILPTLSLGGKGVVSTVANIAPRDVSNMVKMYLNGDIEGSRRLQLGILPLVRLIFSDINPMPVKFTLNLLGFNMGSCRLPLAEIDENLAEALRQEIKRYGLS